MDRFFLDAHGRDDDALRAGFAWLWREATGGVGVAFVPGLRNVDNLPPGLTEAETQQLKKDRRLRRGAATIGLATERSRVTVAGRPVLAVWMDDEQLTAIERSRPASICAIPWNRDDITRWRDAYGPIDVRRGKASPRREISNPVVEAALRTLTALVNTSTGLGHPSDKAAAVRTFEILRSGGESYSPPPRSEPGPPRTAGASRTRASSRRSRAVSRKAGRSGSSASASATTSSTSGGPKQMPARRSRAAGRDARSSVRPAAGRGPSAPRRGVARRTPGSSCLTRRPRCP